MAEREFKESWDVKVGSEREFEESLSPAAHIIQNTHLRLESDLGRSDSPIS